MKSISEKKYSVVDLFAGAGGLSYGFLQTGRYEIKAAFEDNPNAQKTYRYNHPGTAVYGDVSEALKLDLGSIDVVIGGPPCQGFSNANRQKNHAISQNNSLVKKYVQAVLHLKPQAFIMENVSMLQSDVHRFYVDTSDSDIIQKYEIATEPSEIQLLDEEFWFDGVDEIVSNCNDIIRYLWENENDYLVLNVLYKFRSNPKKLEASLGKHKNRLINIIKRFTAEHDEADHIKHEEYLAGLAIAQYFSDTDDIGLESLCVAIEPTIQIQRMLSKAKEILDSSIVVAEYSHERSLVAKVRSMAVIDYIESILGASSNGYYITKDVLSAAEFGVPQKRMRCVVMGVRKGMSSEVTLPVGLANGQYRTVYDAIKDIESIDAIYDATEGEKGVPIESQPRPISALGKLLRNSDRLYNHVSTETTEDSLKRFKAIKPGDNFHSLNADLKSTYSNPERTQNTIYLRLKYDAPSGTVVNIRKSMWIHPVLDRALSIREAARLQTFPDSFVFFGTKDSQYQQVGNAVPPMLAQSIADHLCEYLDGKRR
ncbi:DNA cytosine methyltransferase [Dehalococcoides mccartyi]|uniref:DNA cytosine methyltransferase n=1 Tax=Dehalococcoides mccartyi TaxID=61435 RepID=UPI0002B76BF3|nr:DNA cytosine methyltransferase [Dehalococcoides mccartyi]AGG05891.1 putative modification methylase [Dehalococcoides mccartyi DCMB5]